METTENAGMTCKMTEHWTHYLLRHLYVKAVSRRVQGMSSSIIILVSEKARKGLKKPIAPAGPLHQSNAVHGLCADENT